MVDNTKKARIDYIDLMKGICISLVVIVHCDVAFPFQVLNDMLQNLRMPLYFFLTGLFFKQYGGFKEFIVRKTNKIIIPYVFFAFIPYLLFDFLIHPDVVRGLYYYCFMLIEPYNYPLWFLRSLFISYLLYYCIVSLSNRFGVWLGIVVVIVLSYLSWRISFLIPHGGWSYLYKNLLTSVFSLPFLFVASFSRKAGLLTKSFSYKDLTIVFLIGLLAWVTCVQDNVYFVTAHLGNRYPLLYVSALGGIACLWVICCKLRRIFYFSYVGRYSIVVLGCFAPVSQYLSYQFGLTGIVQAIITLAIMPLMIWFFVKLFPFFTAQKDLIRVSM